MNGDAVQVGVARLASPVGERDHVQGPANASVTLVEYGDYECPYCRAAVAIVEELQQVLPDDLRFVFRHFPLENIHPHARRAAEAAEAAASQGKFFEMHAALFEHQAALEDEDLAAVRSRTRSRHGTVQRGAPCRRARGPRPRRLPGWGPQRRPGNADVLPGRCSL